MRISKNGFAKNWVFQFHNWNYGGNFRVIYIYMAGYFYIYIFIFTHIYWVVDSVTDTDLRLSSHVFVGGWIFQVLLPSESLSQRKISQRRAWGTWWNPSVTYCNARGPDPIGVQNDRWGSYVHHAWCLEVVGRNLLGKGNSNCIVGKKELIAWRWFLVQN